MLDLIARGKTNDQIARELGISLDGAKWHVREILAKLDVSSREEAAMWWRARERLGPRLHRLTGALFSGSGWKLAGGAALLCAAGGAAFVLVLLARNGTSDAAPSTSEISPASVTPAATVGQVGFALCSLTTDWVKPSPGAMANVFSTPRFTVAGDVRPTPVLWAMYLSHFYWIPDFRANSAQIEPASMSAANARDPAHTQQLDCQQHFSFMPKYQELWLLDHKATAMWKDGTTAVIETVPDPRTYQVIAFPWPPDAEETPITGKEPSQFNGVRVVGPTGQLLFSDEYDLGSMTEYDDDGQFVSFSLYGGRTSGTVRLTVPQPLSLELYWNGRSVPGEVSVLDDAGREVSRTTVADSGFWIPAGTLKLAPGASTFHFELSSSDYGGFTLLPTGSPRP